MDSGTSPRMNFDEVVQMIQGAVGYAGVVKGRVLEIYKCVPVPVKVRNTTTSYQHIPVSYEGKDYFLSESSKILVPHGEEVPCSALVSGIRPGHESSSDHSHRIVSSIGFTDRISTS